MHIWWDLRIRDFPSHLSPLTGVHPTSPAPSPHPASPFPRRPLKMRSGALSLVVLVMAIPLAASRGLSGSIAQVVTPVTPPETVKLRPVTYSGNGCPGTVSVNAHLAPNKTLLTYTFDNMDTYIGPQVSPLERIKNCQLRTSLESRSRSASFAISAVTFKGVAILDPGVNLTVSSTWFLSDTASTRSHTITITGADADVDDLIIFRNEMSVPLDQRMWTPCGEMGEFTLNLRVGLRSANESASGQIMNDDMILPGVALQLGLVWRDCDA
jgi:hypothetical protein